MAHLQKYKSEATHAILDHCARSRSGTLERDNIDQSRTPLNLTLGASDPEAGKAAVLDRIKAVKESHTKITKKKVRADAVEFGDWIITAPQSLPANRHQEFFKVTFEFLQQRYGTENVPCGFVHLDESQPHMHCPIVPEKAGKLNGKAVFNRKDLQSFHGDLQNRLEKELGCRVGIVLDEDQAIRKAFSALPSKEFQQLNGIIDEFEQMSADNQLLEMDITRQQSELMKLENQKQILNDQTEALAAEKKRLEEKNKELTNQKDTLESDIKQMRVYKLELQKQNDDLAKGVRNVLAQDILEIKNATHDVFRLCGEYQGLKQSEADAYYLTDQERRAEPLQIWDDQICGVEIKHHLLKEPVVQIPLSQWEKLKDAHNRLVGAYRDVIETLREKVKPLIIFLKKMPNQVPGILKLEKLHERLARYDRMDMEQFRKEQERAKRETRSLTQRAYKGQRVQRPEEQRTKTKRKSRDDDLVR